jgi:RimJ/RimL family protein N-acetyltransferase
MANSEWWLSTERLALRRFTIGDLDWLADLYSDPEVTRYVGGTKDRAKTRELLDVRILQYYEEHPGLGNWMTIERATGTPVGFHLLNHIQGESFIQVGFVLSRAAWGRGIGTEMAAALLRYGFVDLRLPRIVAIADLENRASQHVLLKIGLRRRGERSFSHPAYASQGPLAWFERDRTDWLAERQPPSLDLQPTLQGELLSLRPLRADDFSALYAVASDPLIWEQHPISDRYKEDVFKGFFREALESGGALIAHDSKDGHVIGSSRFHGYDGDKSEVEIGWTFLARSHWGGTYNREMKQLMLRHAFRFVNSVVFLVGQQNLRSQRAMEKIGGVRVGSRSDGSGRDSFVYQITAPKEC